MQSLPGQMTLFPPPDKNADQANRQAAVSQRQWTDRVSDGLCGQCGVNPAQRHPYADATILRATADQYCTQCFTAIVEEIAQHGID